MEEHPAGVNTKMVAEKSWWTRLNKCVIKNRFFDKNSQNRERLYQIRKKVKIPGTVLNFAEVRFKNVYNNTTNYSDPNMKKNIDKIRQGNEMRSFEGTIHDWGLYKGNIEADIIKKNDDSLKDSKVSMRSYRYNTQANNYSENGKFKIRKLLDGNRVPSNYFWYKSKKGVQVQLESTKWKI